MSRPEGGSIGTDQRPRRVAAGPPSPESSRKLDPRIVRLAIGASLVTLGVISLALPTIDSAASVDVLTHPPYSPPPEILRPKVSLVVENSVPIAPKTPGVETPILGEKFCTIFEPPYRYCDDYKNTGLLVDCSAAIPFTTPHEECPDYSPNTVICVYRHDPGICMPASASTPNP